jgi:hypothetical protein
VFHQNKCFNKTSAAFKTQAASKRGPHQTRGCIKTSSAGEALGSYQVLAQQLFLRHFFSGIWCAGGLMEGTQNAWPAQDVRAAVLGKKKARRSG